jgi:hypothetical protein
MPTNLTRYISGEIGNLEDRYPIALLPVRVETRFSGNALKVRIYPDVIHLDRHESELTDAEYQSGISYWQAVWGLGRTNREPIYEAWRKLLRLFSTQRAAWIVEATTPNNARNDLFTPGSTPQFPAQQRRETSWSRPVMARAMPHRWVVILYGADGKERCRAETLPLRAPLAVTFAPLEQPPASADALSLIRDDTNSGWMVDFGEAEKAGMAVTIPNLDATDLTDGFSRVLVFGVNTAVGAKQNGEVLANLLDAHHYTNGLAFVAQGSPTNNIEGLPSAYPPSDPDGKTSLSIERDIEFGFEREIAPRHDGYKFASALRLPIRVIKHVARAQETEQENAEAMNNALWPGTLGYFIEQMLAAGIGETWVDDRPVGWEFLPTFRDFFGRWVHGRGPYPAFRIGTIPYGLLPVTSMDYWEWPQTTAQTIDLRLMTLNQSTDLEWFDLSVTHGRLSTLGDFWRSPQAVGRGQANLPYEVVGATLVNGSNGLVTVGFSHDGTDAQMMVTIAPNVEESKTIAVGFSIPSQPFYSAGIAVSSADRIGTSIALVYMDYIDGPSQATFSFLFGVERNPDYWNWRPSNVPVQSPYAEDLPYTALATGDVDGDGENELILMAAYRDPISERSVVYIRIQSNSAQAWSDPIEILQLDAIQALGLTITVTGELVALVTGVRTEESPNVAGYCVVVKPSGEIVVSGSFPATANTRAIAVSAVSGSLLTGLPRMLTLIRSKWLDASASTQHVGDGSTDADVQLATILSRDASAREAYYRAVVGGDFMRGIYATSNGRSLPNGWRSWSDKQNQTMLEILESLGSPFDSYKTRPADQRLRLFDLAFSPTSRRFTKPLVQSGDIEYLLSLPPTSISGNSLRFWTGDSASLFQRMLRHSMLLEYFDAACNLLVQYGIPLPPDVRRERELIGMRIDEPEPPTRWSIFEQLVDGQTVSDRLFYEPSNGTHSRYFDSLWRLTVRTDELERLFTETIDVFSHRIDAWITSLAAWRLEGMGSSGDTEIYVGAYGWVENLKPKSTPMTETYEETDYTLQTGNAGYIHAPSTDHAATAAILRSGYRSRSGVEQKRLALDLSSERVRIARELLDSVRQGQTLGAYLGYRIERRLHERDLDVYIDPLRRRFPLVPPRDDVSVSDTKARSVVDGLALRQDWGNNDIMRWGIDDLPMLGSEDYEALRAALNGELGIEPTNATDTQIDPLDAAVDLLTAESVYQLVRGNTTGSSAALDALARGMRAPDPEISHTLVSGIPLTHRIALLLDKSLPSDWATIDVTPRAAIEPRLDAWVGLLLGAPSSISCTVRYPAESSLAPAMITLEALKLRPLDLLALGDQIDELNRRVAYEALSLSGVPTNITPAQLVIDYSTGNGSGISMAASLELVRALNSVIGAARPLQPRDLLALNDTSTSAATDPTRDRANTAVETLGGLITKLIDDTNLLKSTLDSTLDPNLFTAIQTRLLQIANFGIADAVPNSQAVDKEAAEALVEKAQTTAEQAQRRIDDVRAITDPHETIRILFQRAIPVLPTFSLNSNYPVDEPTFDKASSRETQIQRWLLDASRVRTALDKWRRLWLYITALSGQRPNWHIAQLPHTPTARWAALGFPIGNRPTANLVSIALYQPSSTTTLSTNECAGLLLDEWVETIPNPENTTGITFNYDAPAAEPPQAVLIAVPPTPPDPNGGTHWSFEALERILSETIDLAQIRTVDGDMLNELGHLLPTMLLAANVMNDTISTTDYEI